MNFSLEKSEHYTLLKTNLTALDQLQAEELTAMVKQELDGGGARYLVVNFANINACNASAVRALIHLGNDLAAHNGLLIISSMQLRFTRLFDKADIVFVPSDAEAIDYIFMDQLEKQFLEEGDNEDEQ